MYYKGIILEIKKEYSLVLCDDGSVVRIKSREGLKTGDEIFYLEEDLYRKENEKNGTVILPFTSGEKKPHAKKDTLMKIAALAAALLLCFGTIGTVNMNNQVYAAVSMDAEKSMQFDLNRKGKVVGITSYGQKLSEREMAEYKGLSIEEAWEKFKNSENDEVCIIGYAVLKGGAKTEQEVIGKIKKAVKGSDIICIKGEDYDLDEAEKDDVSLGSYLSSRFPDDDDLEDFIEDSSKEGIMQFIDNNKESLTEEEISYLINEKEKEDMDDDDDDDDDVEDDDNDDDDDD